MTLWAGVCAWGAGVVYGHCEAKHEPTPPPPHKKMVVRQRCADWSAAPFPKVPPCALMVCPPSQSVTSLGAGVYNTLPAANMLGLTVEELGQGRAGHEPLCRVEVYLRLPDVFLAKC